jgi:hypothetical protein
MQGQSRRAAPRQPEPALKHQEPPTRRRSAGSRVGRDARHHGC